MINYQTKTYFYCNSTSEQCYKLMENMRVEHCW